MLNARTIAVLDACSLYSAPLRDLLMWFGVGGVYAPRWTEQIHAEWMRNVLLNRPDLSPAQIQRTREAMDNAVPDALIQGHENLIPSLSLPDADDRHVLAAAIYAHATLIVTFNLRDFPAAVLSSHGIQSVHPDLFVLNPLTAFPEKTVSMMQRQRANLKNPPHTPTQYLERLEKCGLPRTVAHLRSMGAAV